MCYTISFAVSCLASGIGQAIKMKALISQVRSRRLALKFSADNDHADREKTLRLRLEHCRKDLLLTYAAVLTCALEGPHKFSIAPALHGLLSPMFLWFVRRLALVAFADLPMGILAIFLSSASDTKLSTFTQICTAYSWLNVGGKLLKIAGLKRQLAEESDVKRKLAKLLVNSGNEADADLAALEVTRAGLLNRLKYSGIGKWLCAVPNRKTARLLHTDLEMEFVRAVVIQERQRRSDTATSTAAAIAFEDLGATTGLGMGPSERAQRGAEILYAL
jgi:hypothetical protein